MTMNPARPRRIDGPRGIEVGHIAILRDGRIDVRVKKAGRNAVAVARATKDLKACAGAIGVAATWTPEVCDASGTRHPVGWTPEEHGAASELNVERAKCEARQLIKKLADLGAMPKDDAIKLYEQAFDGAVARQTCRYPEATVTVADARDPFA